MWYGEFTYLLNSSNQILGSQKNTFYQRLITRKNSKQIKRLNTH